MDKFTPRVKIIHMLSFVLVTILFVVAIVWIAGVIFVNDFSLPTADISKFKNVLIVFPHADDEVLTTTGLVGQLKKQGSKITLAVLTKGEKGTPAGQLNQDLKSIRTKEMQQVSSIIGITELIQEDFGDGETVNKHDEIKQYLDSLIDSKKPDLIITYDLSGMYGHPDHIAVAQAVTDLVKSKFTTTQLWYVTYPKQVLGMMNLPERMATDPLFKNKRMEPNIKIASAGYTANKIKGIYAHASQRDSFESAVPIRQVPLWFWHSMPLYEYFYKAN